MKLIFLTILFGYAPALAAPVVAPITIECDSYCPKYIRDALPAQLDRLRVNVMSNCVRDFFRAQKTILETKLTPDQIADKLSRTPVKLILSVYTVPWIKRAFHPECGYEAGDGKIHLKAGCYDVMSNSQRESFYLHELSHSSPLNFTHKTLGNTSSGLNQQTVPYLCNAAYEKCFK